MSRAFLGATNLVLNATDTPNLTAVTDMSLMFGFNAKFNGNINNWDVSNVTNMRSLFVNDSIYNQPLNSLDVSSVTNMSSLFSGATSFNQPLNSWDVSSVTDMSSLFYGASSFNQPLNNWNVSSVTNMSELFIGATSFNQPLNSWDVSSVTDISELFRDASSFNQPLNNWNVSNVKNMNTIFDNATSFNQNIGSWDISSLIVASHMFDGVKLSTDNYDSLLIGWSTLDAGETKIPNNIGGFSGGTSNYCTGADARAVLISKGWTIVDGGKDCSNSTLGIEDISKSNFMVIAKPKINIIKLIGNLEQPASLKIYDTLGRLVENIKLTSSTNQDVKIPNISDGIYILKINSKNNLFSEKIEWFK